MKDYEKRLGDAVSIVREAGRRAQEARNHLRVEHKTENDYVTQVDRDTERFVRESLLAIYPEDAFLGEEYGTLGQARGIWVLDPIDGTTNYIRGIEEYSVSLAYMEDDQPVVGIVFCPALGEIFTAVKGKGASLNGEPIHVSEETSLRESVIGMSFIHRRPEWRDRALAMIRLLLERSGDLRRSGSAALDLCRVAAGRYGAFIEPCLNLYDIAAGVLIVREAGGLVTGLPGEDDALVTGHTLASNGILHSAMEELLKDAFKL